MIVLGILMALGGVVLVQVGRGGLFKQPVPLIIGYLWMLIGAILIVTGLVGS